MNTLKPVLARLAAGEPLAESEAEAAFGIIMAGEATPAQIAGLLMAMRVRGETVAEMTGAVRAMRARMQADRGAGRGNRHRRHRRRCVRQPQHLHRHRPGGRRLRRAGRQARQPRALLAAPARRMRWPRSASTSMSRWTGWRGAGAAGMVFLMAPRHHAALRHAAGPRVELGTRTIFNLLGPLANPARVKRQLTGAFAPAWLRPMAETLLRLGTEAAWVVHGQGLDEIALSGETQVVALEDGTLREFTVAPEDAGLQRAPPAAIRGGEPAENAEALRALLGGAPGAYRDIVLLNAAAALVVAGRRRSARRRRAGRPRHRQRGRCCRIAPPEGATAEA